MQIRLNVIKAAQCCAAVKDIRHYLNGVMIEFNGVDAVPLDLSATICGTDGHTLFAGKTVIRCEDGETQPEAGTQIIIPSDAVKAAKQINKNNPFVTLRQISADTWQLADTIFKPIDGKFPDYRRVIPSPESVASTAQEVTYLDPELLLQAQAALRLYAAARATKRTLFPLAQRGNAASIMHDNAGQALVVIMPYKNDAGNYRGLAA